MTSTSLYNSQIDCGTKLNMLASISRVAIPFSSMTTSASMKFIRWLVLKLRFVVNALNPTHAQLRKNAKVININSDQVLGLKREVFASFSQRSSSSGFKCSGHTICGMTKRSPRLPLESGRQTSVAYPELLSRMSARADVDAKRSLKCINIDFGSKGPFPRTDK